MLSITALPDDVILCIAEYTPKVRHLVSLNKTFWRRLRCHELFWRKVCELWQRKMPMPKEGMRLLMDRMPMMNTCFPILLKGFYKDAHILSDGSTLLITDKCYIHKGIRLSYNPNNYKSLGDELVRIDPNEISWINLITCKKNQIQRPWYICHLYYIDETTWLGRSTKTIYVLTPRTLEVRHIWIIDMDDNIQVTTGHGMLAVTSRVHCLIYTVMGDLVHSLGNGSTFMYILSPEIFTSRINNDSMMLITPNMIEFFHAYQLKPMYMDGPWTLRGFAKDVELSDAKNTVKIPFDDNVVAIALCAPRFVIATRKCVHVYSLAKDWRRPVQTFYVANVTWIILTPNDLLVRNVYTHSFRLTLC